MVKLNDQTLSECFSRNMTTHRAAGTHHMKAKMAPADFPYLYGQVLTVSSDSPDKNEKKTYYTSPPVALMIQPCVQLSFVNMQHPQHANHMEL